MGGLINEEMMNGWKDGLMYDGKIDGWRDRWNNKWMNGWVNGWMSVPESLLLFLAEVKVPLNHLPDMFRLFIGQTRQIQFSLHLEKNKNTLKF